MLSGFTLGSKHWYAAPVVVCASLMTNSLTKTQAQHLHFFMILFGLFDLILLFVCQL